MMPFCKWHSLGQRRNATVFLRRPVSVVAGGTSSSNMKSRQQAQILVPLCDCNYERGGGRHFGTNSTSSLSSEGTIGSTTFVSKYNTSLNVTPDTVSTFLSNHHLPHTPQDLRCNSTHVILRVCPFCTKPHNDKLDNMYKLYIQLGTGAFICHRCTASGSWYDFKRRIASYDVVDAAATNSDMAIQNLQGRYRGTDIPSVSKGTITATTTNNNNNVGSPMPDANQSKVYQNNLFFVTSPDATNMNGVLQYLLNERGLTKQTLMKYGVGMARFKFPHPLNINGGYVDTECVTFPWMMRVSEVRDQEQRRGHKLNTTQDQYSANSKPATADNLDHSDNWLVRRIKVRSIHNKGQQRLDPPGGGWGFFGWHTVPQDAKEVIITEGEFDAMAVFQATARPAISLPSGCRNLPVEVLPLLERFEKIYLWMDSDAPGQEGAQVFANKLGLKRCFIVPASDEAKDANEALLKGMNLHEFLLRAEIVPHERILTFKSLRQTVLHEIFHPNEYAGTPFTSLPQFTSIIKGFRRGEMTVMTGPTGSGKTTFLSQLSLDLAEQGVNTLWGSFEIKNQRLLKKLLHQYCRGPLALPPNVHNRGEKMVELVNNLADRFEALPLYFLKFHGTTEVENVLDAMDYATYVHDCQHIILDNLQFMLTRDFKSSQKQYSHGSYYDKFDMQDIAMEKLRKFATDRNVHLTVVVHPRKEDDQNPLGLSSFYGSAKATQEADIVLILQQNGSEKLIQVKKNRFDGTLGSTPLFYDSASGRYEEVAMDIAAAKQHLIKVAKPKNAAFTRTSE